MASPAEPEVAAVPGGVALTVGSAVDQRRGHAVDEARALGVETRPSQDAGQSAHAIHPAVRFGLQSARPIGAEIIDAAGRLSGLR